MKADWKLIETAPKDGTTILIYARPVIEPVVWENEVGAEYVDEPVLDKYGEETHYAPRGGWVANGLTSHEETRELRPTHWDYMPDAPAKGE